MPRYAREKAESGIFHVMLRGINKQIIFEDEEDRIRFIETLDRYKDVCKFELYGYCLMSNHVHLLLKESEDNTSKIIKRICSSYVYWYNRKYNRCGHLFQERFKSEVVNSDSHLLTVLRYIHKNPVSAGMVQSVEAYQWSSFGEYVNKKIIVDINFVLGCFSEDRQNAIKLFVEHTNQENNDKCLDEEEKIIITDNEIVELIKNFGINNMTEFQNCEKEMRNKLLKELKNIRGVSIRQISRVTGMSKSVIDRI